MFCASVIGPVVVMALVQLSPTANEDCNKDDTDEQLTITPSWSWSSCTEVDVVMTCYPDDASVGTDLVDLYMNAGRGWFFYETRNCPTTLGAHNFSITVKREYNVTHMRGERYHNSDTDRDTCLFYDQEPIDGTRPLCTNSVPTISEWGLVGMTLLGLVAGTVVLFKRRVAA